MIFLHGLVNLELIENLFERAGWMLCSGSSLPSSVQDFGEILMHPWLLHKLICGYMPK